MSENEKLNTDLAREAEQARQDRDGAEAPGTVRVKVIAAHAVTVAGHTHEPSKAFSADEATVEQALARGLVEKVESKAKR